MKNLAQNSFIYAEIYIVYYKLNEFFALQAVFE